MEHRKAGRPNIRIIIILNRFVIGGPVIDTLSLAWHLKSEFDILILSGENGKREMQADFLLRRYPGIKMKKISRLKKSFNPLNDLLAFLKIFQIIVSTKADIVHTHGAKPGVIGRIAACLARVPVVVHTFHGHFFRYYFPKVISQGIMRLERLLGKFTTHCIALSNTQKIELAEEYQILPPSKITIIPLGFSFHSRGCALSQRNEFREQYGLKPDDVAIGIVGRIVPVKNHSFFLNVAKSLLSAPAKMPVAFFIIGDGELKETLEKELHRNGILFNNKMITIGNRVVFTSWITELEKVMNGLDIVVLTSISEGTPLALIEAQYFKKPVVATNVGGVQDIVVDGVTGFVCETDVRTFTDKMRTLIESEELRRQMGEAGFENVSLKFSKEREISATKYLYYTLLKQKGYTL